MWIEYDITDLMGHWKGLLDLNEIAQIIIDDQGDEGKYRVVLAPAEKMRCSMIFFFLEENATIQLFEALKDTILGIGTVIEGIGHITPIIYFPSLTGVRPTNK